MMSEKDQVQNVGHHAAANDRFSVPTRCPRLSGEDRHKRPSLTAGDDRAYTEVVMAQSITGIDTPFLTSVGARTAPLKRGFSMVGRVGPRKRAVPTGGSVNPIRPAARGLTPPAVGKTQTVGGAQ